MSTPSKQGTCTWGSCCRGGPLRLECRTCPAPIVLTSEQSAQVKEVVCKRQPRRAKPLPIEESQ